MIIVTNLSTNSPAVYHIAAWSEEFRHVRRIAEALRVIILSQVLHADVPAGEETDVM